MTGTGLSLGNHTSFFFDRNLKTSPPRSALATQFSACPDRVIAKTLSAPVSPCKNYGLDIHPLHLVYRDSENQDTRMQLHEAQKAGINYSPLIPPPNLHVRPRAPLAKLLYFERSSFGTGRVTDVVSQEEINIEEAAKDTRFSTHKENLNLDYRNSIKESISAVESIARAISGSDKATLGNALRTIEKKGQLHRALKEGFLKLYGYTSDKQGIRHAMLDEPNITAADARYFLVSCSSFANYLKSQLP